MRRVFIIINLLAVTLVFAAPVHGLPGANVDVRYLGYRTYPSFTRVAFDTTTAPPEGFKINYDERRGRVVFYPQGGGLSMGFSPVRIADAAVSGVDFVQGDSGRLGIVVRLGSAALGYKVTYLHEPNRLVLDIYKAARAGPFMPIYREVRTVAIDPGHGGPDTGARSVDGVTESGLALDVAMKLRAMLTRRGFDVALVAGGDAPVTPLERAGRANNARADLYISIHASGSFGSPGRGAAIYTCGEGGLDGRGKVDGTLVWEDQQAPYLPESVRLARRLAGSLDGLYSFAPVIRQARLAGFSGLAMPAVMVELGQLTDPAGAGMLGRDNFRARLAGKLAAGITEYARGVAR